ncbi:MAG: tRNA (adenosine(37)-N6)-dimethylallyltransferase MiaA [Trueperaceae bacterium]
MALLPMLAGPTASGKSAAALHLAERLGLHVVSADSMQVYTGMDIGTAKPSPAERARVPHHLLDVVTPAEAFSVADYVRLAEAAIDTVVAQGESAIVVGGTGFYLRALRTGLPTVPPADPEAQAPLWRDVAAGRLNALIGELAAVSEEDATRAQRNPRRVVRSVEVLRRTGSPPSAFPNLPPAHEYDLVVLDPPAGPLAERVAQRARRMFELGLVDEVRALLARYPEQPTALQAIGYKEVAAHLSGELSLGQALEAVIVGSRRYAKRQRTWFAREAGARYLRGFGEESVDELLEWAAGTLAGGGRRGG